MTTSKHVIGLLIDIEHSTVTNVRVLEKQLAAVPMRDMWSWTLSETKAVERAMGGARKKIASLRAAETRRVKSK